MKHNWEYKNIEECLEKVTVVSKLQTKDFLLKGKFPIVSQEVDYISGYWNNDSDVVRLLHPVVVFGDHSRVVKYIDFDFVVGADGVKILSPKDFLNPKFLYYFVKSADIPSLGYSRHYKLLREKDVPVPPLSEQSRIVAELDLLTGIIDKQNAQLKELDNLAQSIFYDMFGDPIENEKGWNVKKISDVSQDVFAGGDKPEDFKDAPTDEYCYPIIANGIGDRGVLGYSRKYRVGSDAVTIGARGASIGNCRICKAFFTPVVRLITIIPSAAVDITFLYFVVQLLNFNINGAGQAQLTVPNVKSQVIPIPPLALQQSFADKIQSIENQKAKIKASIADTQKLLNYTMDKYFG